MSQYIPVNVQLLIESPLYPIRNPDVDIDHVIPSLSHHPRGMRQYPPRIHVIGYGGYGYDRLVSLVMKIDIHSHRGPIRAQYPKDIIEHIISRLAIVSVIGE